MPQKTIPLSEPEISGNEWRYLKECLDSGWISSAGPFVSRFEREIAACLGARHAVATTSGTTALHVALRVAGVGPNEEVLMPSLTFIAPANAVRYLGAWPVFIGVEPTYWQLDPEKVREFVTRECRSSHGALYNKTSGRRIRAILPVHLLGHPCELDPLYELALQFDLQVVEDATESLGALYKGRRLGSFGHLTCLSFNGNKLITTGGGGMIVTDREDWASRARYLTTQAKDDPLESVHHEIGYNYRLTNVQAAIGCAQFERLDQYIATKRRIANVYRTAFAGLPGITPMPEATWATSTFWLFTIRIEGRTFGQNRNSVGEYYRLLGIETRPLWQPLHRSLAHRGCMSYRCEPAELVQAEALSLPSSVGLKEADQSKVIECLVTMRRPV